MLPLEKKKTYQLPLEEPSTVLFLVCSLKWSWNMRHNGAVELNHFVNSYITRSAETDKSTNCPLQWVSQLQIKTATPGSGFLWIKGSRYVILARFWLWTKVWLIDLSNHPICEILHLTFSMLWALFIAKICKTTFVTVAIFWCYMDIHYPLAI